MLCILKMLYSNFILLELLGIVFLFIIINFRGNVRIAAMLTIVQSLSQTVCLLLEVKILFINIVLKILSDSDSLILDSF